MSLLSVLIFYNLFYYELVKCGVMRDIMTLNELSMYGYFVKVPTQFTPSDGCIMWDNRYFISDVYNQILSKVDQNEIPTTMPADEGIKACRKIAEMLSFWKEVSPALDYGVPVKDFRKEPYNRRSFLYKHSICTLTIQRSSTISTSKFVFNLLFGPVVDSNRVCFLTSAESELIDIAMYPDSKPQDGIRFFLNTFYLSENEGIVQMLNVALASNNEKRTLYTYAPASEIGLDPELWNVPRPIRCLRRSREGDHVVAKNEPPTCLSFSKKGKGGKKQDGIKGKGKASDETEISLDDLIKKPSNNDANKKPIDIADSESGKSKISCEIDLSNISLEDSIGSSSKKVSDNVSEESFKSKITKNESKSIPGSPNTKQKKPPKRSNAAGQAGNKSSEKINRNQFIEPPKKKGSKRK